MQRGAKACDCGSRKALGLMLLANLISRREMPAKLQPRGAAEGSWRDVTLIKPTIGRPQPSLYVTIRGWSAHPRLAALPRRRRRVIYTPLEPIPYDEVNRPREITSRPIPRGSYEIADELPRAVPVIMGVSSQLSP